MRSLDALARARLRRKLLRWYDANQRDLPWRRTDDPYRIWLSEAMLQQTRVETVVPYYERFTERFPDVRALADADEQDVLREWSGLGYYARARNLRRAAQVMVEKHGASVPRDADALAELPGVGRYTSGAVRSIAFGERAPIVDGNVKRVLARWLAEPALSDTEVWSVAEALVPRRRPGDFNQALMELGATVCTPRRPACLGCPVRGDCAAGSSGAAERYPAPKVRAAPPEVSAVCAALRRRSDAAVLLVRRPSRGLLGGLWELPSTTGEDTAPVIETLRERHGLQTRAGPQIGSVRHVFTHRALNLRVHAFELLGGELDGDARAEARWIAPAEREQVPLSRLTRKALEVLDRAWARLEHRA